MIPKNWQWISLLDSFINKTSSNKKIQQKDYLSKGKIAVVDQGQKLIGGYTNKIDLKYDGKLPIILFGDHTRCIKYIDFPFVQGADGVKILEPQKCYLPKALFYIMQSLNIPNLGYRRHFPLFKNYNIPLPPLDEQQRIVDIIENMFSKLDRAEALAQNIIDNYELRRSAILHKAFAGQLIKCDFQLMTINSVCKSLIYGTSKKSSKFGKTIVIRMGNLQNGEIDWSNLAYSDDDDEIAKYNLSVGDVLFNRTNSAELVGKTSIYRGEYPAIYAGYLIKLDYDHNILIGDYFNYMLNAPEAKDYCQRIKTDGVNQSNINAKKIGAFEVPIPNIEEQKEIVRILDNLLAKEQQTKELAEQTLQRIDLMKKAILAKAFRGELINNGQVKCT